MHGRRGCGERLVAVADRLADEAVLVGGAQQARGVVGRHAAGADEVGAHAVERGAERGVADRVVDRPVEPGDDLVVGVDRRDRRGSRPPRAKSATRPRTPRDRGAARRGGPPASRAPRAARTARRRSRADMSGTMPVRPRLVSTRPSSASRARAARNGVRETPSRAASSISLSGVPGASRHDRMSSRSRSIGPIARTHATMLRRIEPFCIQNGANSGTAVAPHPRVLYSERSQQSHPGSSRRGGQPVLGDVDRAVVVDDAESLACPVLEAADHLPHGVPESEELDRRAGRAVARRTPAVDDDRGVRAGSRRRRAPRSRRAGCGRPPRPALMPRRVAAGVDEDERDRPASRAAATSVGSVS